MIGFSTGCFYKIIDIAFEKQFFTYLKDISSDCIELNCLEYQELDTLLKVDPTCIRPFKKVSLHAPAKGFIYDDNDFTKSIMEKVSNATTQFSIDNIVIHPDRVNSWKVIEEYDHLPISIENMDNKKDVGKYVDELAQFLSNNEYGFVLDVNHIISIDETLELGYSFLNTFKDRLTEVHVSGYNGGHAPLFDTKQIELIQMVKNLDIPIIIESVFENLEDAVKELEFINSNI